MLFRPVRENDLDDIVRLAARAGVGMTSLPHDVGRLAARIRRSIETFAGELPRSQQGFLFVLEDTAPVSYTHLDVYKRQAFNRDLAKLAAGANKLPAVLLTTRKTAVNAAEIN